MTEARDALPHLVLPVADLIDLLAVTHAPERIAEYRVAMQRGDRFPAISVVRVLGRYVVADGHKRLSAARALDEREVLVELWPLGRVLADQWRQLVGKTRQQVRVVVRSPFDAGARRQARRLFWDTVLHWRRIARSIAQLLRGRFRGQAS